LKAIDRSRGFRGTKSVLDGLTHAMFEAKPIGVLGDTVNHARLIALLDQALVDQKAKGVVLYAEKFSGEIEHFLSFVTKRSRPYSVTARVRVLEDQQPVKLAKGHKTETPFDLNHDQTPISVDFGHDVVVWFHQNPSEVKTGTKNYFEANDSSHKSLLDMIGIVKPRVVFVPVHLSYLSPEHTFSKLVRGAERMQMLVHWSRGHNTEMWLQFSDYAKNPSNDLVDKINFGFSLAARRKKLINKVRDYLISGGHVFECHGVPMSNEMAEEALHVYCTTRRYVESLRAAASVAAEHKEQREQVSYPDVEESFPSMGLEEKTTPARERRGHDPKAQKRDRSPSVSSRGSSENENDNSKSHPAPPAPEEPEVNLKTNRKGGKGTKGAKSFSDAPPKEKRVYKGKRTRKD